MQPIYTTYLSILKQMCDPTESITLTQEEQRALLPLAERHFTAPFLLPYITDPFCLDHFKKQTKRLMLHYHQIAHLTNILTTLFDTENIPYFLLKGISLAQYYPFPESRKLGDVDIYIADKKSVSRAQKLMESNGFVLIPEVSDHHLTYQYSFDNIGRTFLIELHFRIVGLYHFAPANQLVDDIYSANRLHPVFQKIEEYHYQVLPPTEYAFYLIHHMLKHYLYSGFGIRLLCDFVFFLQTHKAEINFEQLQDWCRTSHIIHLYEIIVESCRIYLGLSSDIDDTIHADPEICAEFIQRILDEKDMGSADASTLVGSHSYRKITPFTYLKEFHLQMHVRFPKLGKCILLWPILWIITFVCFIKNTYSLRKTTLTQTFRTFKEKNQQTQMLKIFDNSDD